MRSIDFGLPLIFLTVISAAVRIFQPETVPDWYRYIRLAVIAGMFSCPVMAIRASRQEETPTRAPADDPAQPPVQS